MKYSVLVFLLLFPVGLSYANDPSPAAEAGQPAGAADQPAAEANFSAFLGSNPAGIIEAFGSPDSVYSLRLSRSEWDLVVFFYHDFQSFYFYKSRVWQIRFDHRYNGKLENLTMGMSPESVTALLAGYKRVSTVLTPRDPGTAVPSSDAETSVPEDSVPSEPPVPPESDVSGAAVSGDDPELLKYLLSDDGYPVYLLLAFRDGKLDDMYLYRGDF